MKNYVFCLLFLSSLTQAMECVFGWIPRYTYQDHRKQSPSEYYRIHASLGSPIPYHLYVSFANHADMFGYVRTKARDDRAIQSVFKSLQDHASYLIGNYGCAVHVKWVLTQYNISTENL